MRPLIIGPKEQQHIAAAIERARARPIPWSVLKVAMPANQGTDTVTLADREPVERARPRSEMIDLPVGFRLAISVEEQPAGMCLHISISVDRADHAPHPAAVQMIAEECLAALPHVAPDPPRRTWTEEFLVDDKPGGLAVNVIFLIAPAQKGTVQ
jgi:hypothetical protein